MDWTICDTFNASKIFNQRFKDLSYFLKEIIKIIKTIIIKKSRQRIQVNVDLLSLNVVVKFISLLLKHFLASN